MLTAKVNSTHAWMSHACCCACRIPSCTLIKAKHILAVVPYAVPFMPLCLLPPAAQLVMRQQMLLQQQLLMAQQQAAVLQAQQVMSKASKTQTGVSHEL